MAGRRAGDIGRKLSRGAYARTVIGLAGALAASVVLATVLGAVSVAPADSLRIVANHLVPGTFKVTWQPLDDQIISSFRLPRVVLGVVVGAGLAVVGGDRRRRRVAAGGPGGVAAHRSGRPGAPRGCRADRL